jgi:hypothetical protein
MRQEDVLVRWRAAGRLDHCLRVPTLGQSAITQIQEP